jgi:hypothetical protein
MNKRLTIFLIIVFALTLTFLIEVLELQFIHDNVLLFSIGSLVLANVIGALAGKRQANAGK